MDKDLDKRIVELRGKQFSVHAIKNLVGIEDINYIQSVLDKDKLETIEMFKKIDRKSPDYSVKLINAVRLLRSDYNMNYREIAKALKESEYVIFDIIRRQPVSRNSNGGYARAKFTREEKRMRNKDIIRLNKEGKTLLEIGRIYFTSKQNISAIMKELEYQPISQTEALGIGAETPDVDVRILELESKIEELKEVLTSTRKRASIEKYHMNSQILDLRIGYVTALMENICFGKQDDETLKQYKALRHTLRRTYNALISTNAGDTIEVQKLNGIMPKLEATDKEIR